MVLPDLEIRLESMPPSLNNAYKTVIVKGRALRALTSEARRWKLAAGKQMQVAARRAGWTMEKKTPLVIGFLYLAPNIFVWDIDGKLKLAIDAFCEVFSLDDRYVMDLHVAKRRAPQEQTIMRVRVWNEEHTL